MLLRAAPRSLRAGSRLLRPAQSVQSPLGLRQYASKNKSPKPTNSIPDASNHASNRPTSKTESKQDHSQRQSTRGNSQSGKPLFSPVQEEFETSQASEKNTAPRNSSPSAIDPAKAKEQQEETQIPFHDLTKGIPSTLDAELKAASKRQQGKAQEEEHEPSELSSSSGGRGERRMPPGGYETSADKRRNKIMSWTLVGMALAGVGGVVYFGRNWDSQDEERSHPDAPSGWGLGLFYNRIWARLGSTMDYYKEPAFPRLLPDPDPAWQRPYTLVLSLEDLLVHSEWSREHGWRMAKRPGVDYFLRYLSQYYELVIFTSLPSMSGAPVVQKLDPFQIVMWPLFREATKYQNGEYVKDLSYLNRDLSKVILIDTEKSHAALQPENAIILPKWKGGPGDGGLIALIPFLEYVAALGLDDTRKVLASFEGKDIPTEFSRREAQARERFQKQLAEERAKRPRRSGVGFLGSALGIKSGAGMETVDGMPTFAEGFEQGKMLHDQIRERGQKNYEAIDKEIRENGEKWLKEMAEEQKRQQEEAMKGMTAGFKGWFGGGPGKSNK